MEPETIGWIGTASFAVASIYVAHKKIVGFWWMIAGNIMFGVVGCMTELWSLVVTSVMMTLLDFYAIFKWRKDG